MKMNKLNYKMIVAALLTGAGLCYSGTDAIAQKKTKELKFKKTVISTEFFSEGAEGGEIVEVHC